MSGLNSTINKLLVNALIGKRFEYGVNQTLTNKESYKVPISPVSHIDSSGNPTTFTIQGTSGAISTSPYYSDFESGLGKNTDPISAELTSVYLGLLWDKPITYSGVDSKLINGKQYINKYPQKYVYRQKDTSKILSTRSFTTVPEIPGNSCGSYFHDVDTGNPDSSKILNGYYWSSYKRFHLNDNGTISLNSTDSIGSNNIEYKTFTPTVSSSQSSLDDSSTNTDILQFDTELQEYLGYYAIDNSGYLFIGENENTVAWPAVKYFGLFTEEEQSGDIYLTQQDEAWQVDDSLYYWGELTENESWYNHTTDSSTSALKTYYYKDSLGQFVVWTAESGITFNTENIYEKTGIILQPGQGGLFNRHGFTIEWQDTPLWSNTEIANYIPR